MQDIHSSSARPPASTEKKAHPYNLVDMRVQKMLFRGHPTNCRSERKVQSHDLVQDLYEDVPRGDNANDPCNLVRRQEESLKFRCQQPVR